MALGTAAHRQLQIAGLAVCLWSGFGSLTFLQLVAAYVLVWIAFNLGVEKAFGRLGLSGNALSAAVVLLLLPAAVSIWHKRAQLASMEGLDSAVSNTRDRLRLEDTPSIAPPLVVADAPQTFYVHAPDAASVTVRFGDAMRPMSTQVLGYGVFRLSYDPRQHGAPYIQDAATVATLDVDGSEFRRPMRARRAQPHPRWLAGDPERGLAVTVSEDTDELIVIHRDGAVRRIPVGDGPSDCALWGDEVAVSHRYVPELWAVDLESGKHRVIPIPAFQGHVATSPDGDAVAVTFDGQRRGVAVVSRAAEAEAEAEAEILELPFSPEWIIFGKTAHTLVVSSRHPASLHRLRRGANGFALDPELPLGRPAVTLARAPGGAHAAATVTFYEPTGAAPLGNHNVQDQILTVDLERFAVTDQIVTARGAVGQDEPGSIVRGISPMQVAPISGARFVTFAGSDEVWRLDGSLATRVIPPRALREAGLYAPHGIADLGADRIAVTSPAAAAVGVFTTAGQLVVAQRLDRDESTPTRLRRRGERVFYEGTRSGVSCQSCHLHGTSDHSLHDILPVHSAPGVRYLTVTVAGRAATSPYLREAGYATFGHFISRLADRFYRGYLREDPDRAAALSRYLEDLPRPVNPAALVPRDLERESRGLSHFMKSDCRTCHPPPAFTNLSQHPARTIFPNAGQNLGPTAVLDVPSLLSLERHGPFLFDGRAKDLHELLRRHNELNRHGDTASLDEAALADLIHFLQGL